MLKVTIAALILLVASLPAESKRHPRKKHRPTTSQFAAERSQNEKALQRLQQEIAKYESELHEHEKKERQSKQNIRAFDKRTANLKAMIARLQAEASALQGTKNEVDRNLHVTATTLDTLKQAYARSSRQLYMDGALTPINPNEFLLAPTSSDPIRMSYYAQAIARAHAMNRSRLDSMKQSLAESSNELAGTIESEKEQIGEHQTEASTLEEKKAAETEQLSQIQTRKAALLKLIAARKASEKQLEGIIANLIARERAERIASRSERRTRRGAAARAFENDGGLGAMRAPHTLAWPSASHHILQGFGEHRNADLNTVTMNLGIDIAAKQGSVVRAAAEGKVALISSLPSYGTIIVLEHAGGLHTVYANLSSVTVRQGQHVGAGTIIGTSGVSDENVPQLHFEVWSGKARQNPMGWLR